MLERQREFERANEPIRQTKCCRTPAGAVRVEQVKHFFFADRRRHRNAGLLDFRKTCAQRPRPRHDTGDAEADVIGALVAKHLRRRAGHDGAFDGWRAIRVDELFRQRREKTRCRRAEPDADDVRIHALAFNGWNFRR